ncbi:MAG TPA: LPS assembly lipoprotein LptE [Rhizomicrobium sp.]|nr:LPS assembly lipoprotein LptE [Rhizomicrobium sp.]
MRKLGTLAALGLAFAASGCGFHPLYGSSGATAETMDKLSQIYVDPIPQSLGYELRNELIDLFDSSGRASEDSYRLHVTFTQKSEGVAVQNDAAITRYNDTMTITYVLSDMKGKEITKGVETGLAAYNVVASPYATLTAQKDADVRSAVDIAYRIRTNLAVYFAQEAKRAASAK